MSDGGELLAQILLEPSWSILVEQEGHSGVFKGPGRSREALSTRTT